MMASRTACCLASTALRTFTKGTLWDRNSLGSPNKADPARATQSRAGLFVVAVGSEGLELGLQAKCVDASPEDADRHPG